MDWKENLKKAPDGTPIILKVNHGLFSGGWQWHKAIRINNKFFNLETKKEITDPHSWDEVKL